LKSQLQEVRILKFRICLLREAQNSGVGFCLLREAQDRLREAQRAEARFDFVEN
jgi:hypothetical protein